MDGKSFHQCAQELVLASYSQVERQLPVTVHPGSDDRARRGKKARQ